MPTSTKPKPRAGMARTAAASLSKPAASPTGLRNSRPNRVWRRGAGVHQVAPGEDAAEPRHRLGGAQGGHAEAVGSLGVEAEEEPAESGVDGHGGGIVPSACQDGTGLTVPLFDNCGIVSVAKPLALRNLLAGRHDRRIG